MTTETLQFNTEDRGRAHIAAVSVVAPPYAAQQSFAAEFFQRNYAGRLVPRSMSLISQTCAHPGIQKRHFAFDEPECLIDEDPDSRIARFTHWATALSAQAVGNAMSKAGLAMQDITGLIVNTCTGYICPGISTYLIEQLGLRRDVRAYDLVGGGCAGAIPNLQMAQAMLNATEEGVIVSVAVEICSATFQIDNDPSLLISNALFGDGAAAAVLWSKPKGAELVGSAGRYVPEQRDAIRFVHKNGNLHNQLSAGLPKLVGQAAAEVTQGMLAEFGLGVADIKYWALHTGGEKIINAVRDEIGIPEAKMGVTRKVLKNYGNMSSPTVWFVMDEILNNGAVKGDWCVMLTYGAGLSAHAALLRI